MILAFVGYRHYIKKPKERRAQEEMFMAERYFEKDSVQLALFGDGVNLGFVDIIEEYGNTASGNLARYYAGILYLNNGEFENAIDVLEDFDADDELVGPTGLGLLGDAYIETGDIEKAAELYVDAADLSDNNHTAPRYLLRAGKTYEMLLEDPETALGIYKRIKKEYPSTLEGSIIDKYIARVETKLPSGS